VLLAQVKMCEGFNAFRSQDVLFLGRDWSPAINAQAEDRAHRMGQKGTVNVQIPIVRKTIEVMIHKRLLDKAADAQQALRSVTIEELMEAL
jgi:SNF2 family DNA or RNA helicase